MGDVNGILVNDPVRIVSNYLYQIEYGVVVGFNSDNRYRINYLNNEGTDWFIGSECFVPNNLELLLYF